MARDVLEKLLLQLTIASVVLVLPMEPELEVSVLVDYVMILKGICANGLFLL